MSVKISALPVATSVGASDLIPIVQGGVTKQATPTLRWTFGGGILNSTGSAAAPSYAFTSASTTGLFQTGGNTLSVTANSTRCADLYSGGLSLGDKSLGFGASVGATVDVLLLRDSAANTLALRNGTNAQVFGVYNTFTDASNYERGVMEWSGNVLTIGQQWAGTGGVRTTQLRSGATLQVNIGTTNVWQWSTGGHLLTVADNTYDLGASGATRPRTGYFGTSAVTVGVFSGDTNSLSLGTSASTMQWEIVHAGGLLRPSGDNLRDIGQVGVRPRTGYFGTSVITPVVDSGGAVTLSLKTNTGTSQLDVLHTASATRNVTITGSNGGNPTISTTAGSLAITPDVTVGGGAGTVNAGAITSTSGNVAFFPTGTTTVTITPTAVTSVFPLTAMSGTAIPAGGTTGAGLKLSSTANYGVFFGSGAPTLTAAKGSLYLRSDGSATNNRAYINTDGSTTWTALTTAA